MKRFCTLFVAITIALSLTLTSCIGSFSLLGKVKSWNDNVSDKKWVNEVVFVAFWILPVYELTGLADLLVMNAIEFWSGENPVDENVLDIKLKDGAYHIVTDKTGHIITNTSTGEVTHLIFDKTSKTWSVEHDGKAMPFLTWIDENSVAMPDADGTWRIVERDRRGDYAWR